MLTSTQTHEIDEFLKTRNLPINILAEVKDHFVTQITNDQQKTDFQNAFSQAKKEWENDLKISTGSSSTHLVKQINRQKRNHFLKKTLVVVSVLLILQIILSKILPTEYGVMIFAFAATVLLIMYAVYFFKYLYQKYFIWKHPEYKLQILNVSFFTLFIIIFFIIEFNTIPTNSFKAVNDFVKEGKNAGIFTASILNTSLFLGFIFYSIFVINDNLKAIRNYRKTFDQ